jgi:hypothetical protein
MAGVKGPKEDKETYMNMNEDILSMDEKLQMLGERAKEVCCKVSRIWAHS